MRFFPIISVLRVGKSVDFVHSALQSLHISDNVLRWTITLSKINQAVYLLFDHIVLAGRIGLAKVDLNTIDHTDKLQNKTFQYNMILLAFLWFILQVIMFTTCSLWVFLLVVVSFGGRCCALHFTVPFVMGDFGSSFLRKTEGSRITPPSLIKPWHWWNFYRTCWNSITALLWVL